MLRRCRYRPCGEFFQPAKPSYWFCRWDHHQRHHVQHDYRGYARSDGQSYDRGDHDGARVRPSYASAMPPQLWKAFAVLVHPDRWQHEPGLLALSHEAMIWLNAHKPVSADREDGP
jgi:hypothetical protein